MYKAVAFFCVFAFSPTLFAIFLSALSGFKKNPFDESGIGAINWLTFLTLPIGVVGVIITLIIIVNRESKENKERAEKLKQDPH